MFRAFLDADAMAKWLPPYGFTCKVHHMEAKVGGTFRMSFTNFTTGNGHSFGGEYLEIVPNERIRYTDRFDDPNLPGVIEVTVVLKAVSCGTEINIEQANLPTVIPGRSLLSGLATIARPACAGRRAGHSGIAFIKEDTELRGFRASISVPDLAIDDLAEQFPRFPVEAHQLHLLDRKEVVRAGVDLDSAAAARRW